MANITPGDYYIANAANPNLRLDVSKSSFKNGSNIQVWAQLRNDAQTWQVTVRDDGSLQIASRICGKTVTLHNAQLVEANNIELYDDQDKNAQKWFAVEDGTITYSDQTYTSYRLNVNNHTSWTMGISNAAAGGNVQIVHNSTSQSSKWIFIPVPIFQSGGVYEIRSMLDTDMALDVLDGSTANGANIQVFPHNGKNAQKFILTLEEGNKWSIRNVGSGKYVDVKSGAAVDGTNVQTWTDADNRQQRWRVLRYGTTIVDGVECEIVKFGSYVTTDGDAFCIDVQGGDAEAFQNVQIYNQVAGNRQRWALLPTKATDPTMSVPYNLGMTDEAGVVARKTYGVAENMTRPVWNCSPAWCTDGSNHYQMRYRKRFMNSRSAWNEWSTWTGWKTVVGERSDTRTIADPINTAYTIAEGKVEEVEIQVRCAGEEELKTLVGNAASQVMSVGLDMNVQLTATWGPRGLVCEYTSDYDGENIFYIDAIAYTLDECKTKTNIHLDEPLTFSCIGSTGHFTITRGHISEWYDEGTEIAITGWFGYDQLERSKKADQTLTVSYDGGDVIEPRFVRIGERLIAEYTKYTTNKVWVKYDNKLVQMEEAKGYKAGSGKVAFEISYPMNGSDFEVFTEGYTDSTHWGWDCSTYRMPVIGYAWTVDGASYSLRVFVDDLPVQNYTKTAVYETNVLDARDLEVVSFAATKRGAFSASGVLLKESTSNVNDFEALVGKHCVFRDIHGSIRNVAITEVDISRHYGYDEVSVAMVEESV